MRPLTTIRDRLNRVPTAVLRRSDAAATRARILADARAVSRDVPRDADPGHLVRAARRLVRRAARDEFAREGVALVRLPEGWGRAELRRADVPGDASFHAFVEEVLSAIDIAPSLLERDDALELRGAAVSADAYGPSLETAADLASFLLSRAWELAGEEHEEADETADEPADEPADEQEFFSAQAARIREDVRATLERQVRVPLELRAALVRHERVESGYEDPAAGDGAGDQDDGPAGFAGEEPGRPGADGRSTRESFTRRARAAYDFAQSEAGRATFDVLRNGAEKAYRRYGDRTGSGPPRKD